MKPTIDEVLNDTAEWHALGIGAFIGATIVMDHPAIAGAVIAAVLGAQAKRQTHLADAKAELAYLMVGALVVIGGSIPL
jgi:hypothetical protein